METKRQISWYRSQILGMLKEGQEGKNETAERIEFAKRYDSISVQIRTHIDLDNLRSLWQAHKSLYSDLRIFLEPNTCQIEEGVQEASVLKETTFCSSKSERKFTHYKSTTQKPFNKLNTSSPAGSCFQESVAEPAQIKAISDSGVQHVRLGMAVNAASQRFRDHLPDEPSWNDIVEAAYRVRRDLEISQASWGRACQLLGRNGAALCVLVTDRAQSRLRDPVRSCPAYFQGLVKKATDNQLNLGSSIFGFLSCGRPNGLEKA